MIKLGILAAVLVLSVSLTVTAVVASNQTSVAILSGNQEVPPRDSNARGVAQFKVNEDSTEIEYRLNVANIKNVVASHIHVGAQGTNGPVVAFLYGSVPSGG